MSGSMAFISGGKLFIKDGDHPPKEHTSSFAQDMIDRALQRHQKNSWKNRDNSNGDILSSRSLWGVGSDPANVRVMITAVSKASDDGEIVYALATEVAGGLFAYNLDSKKERRLFHRESLLISDLSRHPISKEHICAVKNANGTSSIALVEASSCTQLTEGDCLDEAPSWVVGDKKEIIYHSAGIGRNQSGYAVGLGPFAIQKLDMKSGELTALAEDSSFDFLQPRMVDGQLFYIRRPYETFRKTGGGIGTMVKDIVFFPFRLARAIFGFLNFFSVTFSNKTLTTAGGPKTPGPDQQTVFLRGRMVEAQRALSKANLDEETAPLVPSAWELIQRNNDKEEVLAKGVVAFDFDDDNNLVFSNGRAVFRLRNGKQELLFKAGLIESIVDLGERSAQQASDD